MAKVFYYLLCILIILLVITTGFFYFGKNILGKPAINQPFSEPENKQIIQDQDLSIAGGVVPHHLAAKPIIDQFWQKISGQKPGTIILLSPDHFNKGELSEIPKLITVGLGESKFENINVAQDLLAKFAADKFTFDSADLEMDHGILAQLNFIKKYLPESKILPFLIPADISGAQISDFTKQIAVNADSQTVVIASVDFSHYLPRQAADLHDAKSLAALVDFNKEQFSDLEVDCWQCLYASHLYAQLKNKDDAEVLAHKNSLDFLAPLDPEKTTSYFTIIFNQSLMPAKNLDTKTLLFVGDLMLDRGVEDLMSKNSLYYPFEQINQFFRGVDVVFANLEGPIVKNPPKFPDHSLQFAFAPQVTTAMNFSGINLVSLANNHISNMGSDGLQQTREFLKENKINFAGDPNKCSKDFAYQNDFLILLAFNKTNSACTSEEILKTITEIKAENKNKLLVVSIHWGQEYKTSNTDWQQKLGRQMIDAGADVIIGHHPHVVENIESYKNKLIFYSLGNFVFDQYFSKNTQEGLAVGLELNNNKLIYRLFPLQLNSSQPHLMKQTEADKFLEVLANKSSEDLKEKIKSGIIEMKSEL